MNAGKGTEWRAGTAPQDDAALAYLDVLPDAAILLVGREIRYANPSAERLLGAQRPLAGRTFEGLVVPEDLPLVLARVAQVEGGGGTPSPAVLRLVRDDGTIIDVESHGGRAEVMGRPGRIAILRDLRERRQADAALEQSESRLRAVLDGMQEGVLVQDLDLKARLWNPAALRLLGATAERLTRHGCGDPQWRVTDEHGMPLDRAQLAAARALATGAPATILCAVERADGTVVQLQVASSPLRDPAGRVDGVVTTFADVSPLRRATDALRHSEERLRLVAGSVEDVVSLRSRAGRILWASPSHARVLGYETLELLRLPPALLVHPDDLVAWDDARARLAETQRATSVQLRLLTKAGRPVAMDLQLAPLPHDADGRYVVAGRDMTGQVALEAERRRVETLEALARMATGAAHDVNNVLTAVQLAADALGPGQAATAREIAGAVARTAAIARGLQAFSRTAHRAPEHVSLLAWLRPALHAVHGAGAVHVVEGPGAADAIIAADPTQLVTLLHALVHNAREAMGPDGVVTVRLDAVTVTAEASHAAGVPIGAWAALAVEDTGRGMSDATLARAIEPYFTTKPPGTGDGLGLSAVHGIVTQAGGVLNLRSAEGHGTSVVVYWPLAASPPAPSIARPEAPPATATPPVPARLPREILVVDDDAPVRAAMTRALAAHGHAVREAATAAEAEAAVHAHGPALLVCDVRMPGMSGQELVARLLADGVDLPVLFVSGQLDVPLLAARLEGMPRRFLAKPFSAAGLAAAVAELLALVP